MKINPFVFLLFLLYSPFVFSQNAVTTNLEYKLKMHGYADQEIKDILSGKTTIAELRLRLRLGVIGFNKEEADIIIERKITIAELEKRQKLNMLGYSKEDVEMIIGRFFPNKNSSQKEWERSVPVLALLGLRKREVTFQAIVSEASREYRVDQAWIYAVMRQESSFNSGAVSPVGARGLMQLMPDTAYMLGVNDSFDPRENIMGGTKYLKQQIDRFDGNMDLVLAAYNSGPERVARLGRIPRIEETVNYVKMVKSHYKKYSKMQLAQAPTE